MVNLTGQDRAQYVEKMFSRISSRYDRLNTIMTAGRHHAWRRLAVKIAITDLKGPGLDIATGTGDFAIELAMQPEVDQIVGLDFAKPMLPIAIEKSDRHATTSTINYIAGDAHSLPFADNTFTYTTVGFGLRNFIDIPAALSEMVRVIQPGGRLIILEIVRMKSKGLLPILLPIYFRYITPWMGTFFAGDREAYTYLPESVEGFMSADEIADAVKDSGLLVLRKKSLGLGTVSILIGEKQGASDQI